MYFRKNLTFPKERFASIEAFIEAIERRHRNGIKVSAGIDEFGFWTRILE